MLFYNFPVFLDASSLDLSFFFIFPSKALVSSQKQNQQDKYTMDPR